MSRRLKAQLAKSYKTLLVFM